MKSNACTIEIETNLTVKRPWYLVIQKQTTITLQKLNLWWCFLLCFFCAIRDPLSGRAFVFQAMRLTDSSPDVSETLPGATKNHF